MTTLVSNNIEYRFQGLGPNSAGLLLIWSFQPFPPNRKKILCITSLKRPITIPYHTELGIALLELSFGRKSNTHPDHLARMKHRPPNGYRLITTCRIILAALELYDPNPEPSCSHFGRIWDKDGE